MTSKLRVATRRSKLALTQTRWVIEEIRRHAPGLEVEEVQIVTQGDKILDVPLARVGGKGLFVSELENALLDGRADIAVHSLKDLPVGLAEGLEVMCIPEREDPRDVLVTMDGATLFDLEAGSRVGTSSLRRVCQLRAQRNDLAYVDLRGNIDTRLRKLEEGTYRGIILAYAGMRRLGVHERPLAVLDPEVCLPAVGQGALAIEARSDDSRIRDLLTPLEHVPTRLEIVAERTLLSLLEGGCQVPIGAHARVLDGGARLRLDGLVGSLKGETMLCAGTETYAHAGTPSEALERARALGVEVAGVLLKQGARALIEAAKLDAAHSVH